MSIQPGARVRILWSQKWPTLAGEEGFVQRALTAEEMAEANWKSEWVVIPDLWGSSISPDKRNPGFFAPSTEQLEVIKPEGSVEVSLDTVVSLFPQLQRVLSPPEKPTND